MSDYYANPISIPGGVMSPDVSSLYGGYGAGVGGGGAGVGGLSSLLGRASQLPGALSTFQGPSWLGGTGELGVAGVARSIAPPLIASQLATAGINSLLPSTGGAGNVREVLGDAATGAGAGAALGSVVPGIGTLAGGVAGGVGGGLYGLGQDLGLFGGGDNTPSSSDYKQSLATAASQYGLNPTQYTAAYDLLTKSGADSKTVSAQLAQQLLSDAATQRQTIAQQQQATQQRSADQQFALAMQAQAQQFFTPYVNNIITAGQSQAELLKSQAANLPAPYRDVFLNQAQQAIGQSQRLAGAYAAQSAGLPSQYMYSQDVKRQAQLAQLQYQTAVVNAQSGGSGNFNSLVQQLASQGQSQQAGG